MDTYHKWSKFGGFACFDNSREIILILVSLDKLRGRFQVSLCKSGALLGFYLLVSLGSESFDWFLMNFSSPNCCRLNAQVEIRRRISKVGTDGRFRHQRRRLASKLFTKIRFVPDVKIQLENSQTEWELTLTLSLSQLFWPEFMVDKYICSVVKCLLLHCCTISVSL